MEEATKLANQLQMWVAEPNLFGTIDKYVSQNHSQEDEEAGLFIKYFWTVYG